MADGSPSMLLRALFALVVGCVAVVVACTDDATDVVPELQEQQAAVEVEQEVEQKQERSTERRGAAPAPAVKADTAQESQPDETAASAEPADSEASEQPAETQTANTAASQSGSSNAPAENSQQSAPEEPSEAQAEPEASEPQSQRAAARPEPQPEPEPEQEAPTADNNVQEDAEESHVAQPPAIDPETDTEAEQTARVAPTPVGSDDNAGGSGGMTQDEPAGGEPLGDTQLEESGQTGVVPISSANTYTWQDGKYTRTITHQADLTVTASAEGGSEIGPRQAGGAQSDSQPVFQSDTGETMTLPGGVLLVLDAEWDQARIDRFFKDNHVDRGLVQERTFTTNAYFIETEPGFPSLNLANELAGQDGVLLSSPNWQTEVELQ